MAKRLLLNALIKVLGEFIELNEENLDLNLAIWSGKIVLHNLKLKTDKILRNFNVSILHGSIRTLEIFIPWATLLASPVKILIDGVFLQISPLDLAALDRDDTRKLLMEAKLQKLDLVDKLLDFAGASMSLESDEPMVDEQPSDGKQNPTYVQAWISKIVDNIEVTLQNVHLRYEDSKTLPGITFSAGLTLRSLLIASCDENWKPNFMSRNVVQGVSTMRKIIKVENLGIYWNTRSESTRSDSFEDWLAVMQSYIISKESPARKADISDGSGKAIPDNSTKLKYIFVPPNTLTVRLIQTDGEFHNHVPKVDVIIDTTNLALALDIGQLHQLIATAEMMGELQRQRQPFSYRPVCRPTTRYGIRQWWQYAFKVIVKKRRYIELVKKSKSIDEETGWIDMLTADERLEMHSLEEKIPLHALVIFRHCAAREMQREAKELLRLQEKAERDRAEAAARESWWGSWVVGVAPASSSDSDDKDGDTDTCIDAVDDDEGNLEGIAIKDLISQLNEDPSGKPVKAVDPNASQIRLTMVTSASLELSYHSEVAVKFSMALSATVNVTANATNVVLDIQRALLVDSCTPSPVSTVMLKKSLKDNFLRHSDNSQATDGTALRLCSDLAGSQDSQLSLQEVGQLDNEVETASDLGSLGAGGAGATGDGGSSTPASTAASMGAPPGAAGGAGGEENREDSVQEGTSCTVEAGSLGGLGGPPSPPLISPPASPSKRRMGARSAPASPRRASATSTPASSSKANDESNATISIEINSEIVIVKVDVKPMEGLLNKRPLQCIVSTIVSLVLGEKKEDEAGRRRQRRNHAARMLKEAALEKAGKRIAGRNASRATPFWESLKAQASGEGVVGSVDVVEGAEDRDEGAEETEANDSSPRDDDAAHPISIIKQIEALNEKQTAAAAAAAVGERNLALGWKPSSLQRDMVTGDLLEITHIGSAHVCIDIHMPKFILPEDCCLDEGYLQLDAGLMSIHGMCGMEGNCWDIIFLDASMGLPMKAKEIYSVENPSPYLLQPMDFILQVQNIDKSIADMTINGFVPTALRGEIDPIQLGRFIRSFRELFAMLFIRPDPLPPKPQADIGEADEGTSSDAKTREAELTDKGLVTSGSTADDGIDNKPLLLLLSGADGDAPAGNGDHVVSPDRGTDADADLSFQTATDTYKTAFDDGSIEQVEGDDSGEDSDESLSSHGSQGGNDDDGDTGSSSAERKAYLAKAASALRQQLEEEDRAMIEALRVITPQIAHRMPVVLELDPTHVWYDFHMIFPDVSMELVYDTEEAEHLKLDVQSLDVHITVRPHDLNVEISTTDASILDSRRCDSQRMLLCSKNDSGLEKMVSLTYSSIKSRKSPLFKKHGSQMNVDFPHLVLNADVESIMHLRPFTAVILARGYKTQPPTPPAPPPPPPPPPEDTNVITLPDLFEEQLTGILITLEFHLFSIQLLRTRVTNRPGELLESAFSMEFVGMVARVELVDLVRANLCVRAVDVIDDRGVSRDQVYRKVFCPVRDVVLVKKPKSSSSGASLLDALSSAPEIVLEEINEMETGSTDTDVLQVNYYQEARTLSFITFLINNTACFVSLETALDLFQIFIANFFACLDLMSSPWPQLPAPPPAQAAKAPATSGATSASSSPQDSPVRPADATADILIEAPTADPEDKLVMQSTMNINLKVLNPRLIVLDDPTTDESRALVSKSEIEVHYTRDTRLYTDRRQLQESLHLSLRDNEMFVLVNMLNWLPQPVLEPFGLEFHLRRRSVDGIAVSSDMSLDTDNLTARMSINDLRVVQSILTRRTASEDKDNDSPSRRPASPPAAPAPAASAAAAASSLEDKLRMEAADPSAPTYTLSVNVGSMSLTAVNDFNGQNIPILRALLDGATFFAEGFQLQRQIKGEGSFIASADFYNSTLSVWEPVLEKWHPSVAIVSMGRSISLDVKSDHTLQLTVSGLMMEKLLQSYALLLRSDDTFERELVPEITMRNSLGVAVGVLDSASGTKLMTLEEFQTAAVPKVVETGRKYLENSVHLPAAVDIHFTGALGEQRYPLFHLPFNINKPRVQNLHLHDELEREFLLATQTPDEQHSDLVINAVEAHNFFVDDGGGDGGGAKRNGKLHRSVVMEPILEEVFENSRYDPITGVWRAPYLLGDPYQWTDASLTIRRDIQSIELVSDKWEWMDSWTIDVQGAVGIEVDEEGWEYASSFSYFSIASHRRTSVSMDSCRRRRWTRTRVPTAATIDERFRPLAIFWDVKPMSNGSKMVELRSGLQLSNKMPFPISVLLSNNSWKEDFEMIEIAENETRSVPLLKSYASFLKVKPSDSSYGWSRPVSCSIRTYDFSAVRDILCESAGVRPACVRVALDQVDRSLTITFAPYVIITNRLPCDLAYRCKAKDYKHCEGTLASGASCKLSTINLAFHPHFSFQVGDFDWSPLKRVDLSSDAAVTCEMESPRGGVGLVISMAARSGLGLDCGMQLDVFSKSVVIDRTGLSMSIWAEHDEEPVIRHTFPRTRTLPMERTYSTPNERKKRLTAFRTAAKSAAKNAHAAITMNAPYPSATLARSIASSNNFTSKGLESLVSPSDRDINQEEIDMIIFEPSPLLPEAFEGDDQSIERSESSNTLLSAVSSAASDLRRVSSSNLSLSLSQVDVTGTPVSILDIWNFRVASDSHFALTRAKIGDFVYADRKLRWTHLPVQMLNQLYIRTPFADKNTRSRHLIEFEVSECAIVLVLVSSAIRAPPRWLEEDGYHRIVQQGVARVVHKGRVQETHYSIFGKVYAASATVTLRGNWCKDNSSMYAAFIIPVPDESAFTQATPSDALPSIAAELSLKRKSVMAEAVDRIYEQVTYDEKYSRSMANECWAEGGSGLSMFHSDSDKIAVAVEDGEAWSEDLSINMTTDSSLGALEVVNWDTMKAYQLSYSYKLMPGLFSFTQQVTIIPRYCIVNCLDEPIMVVQRGSREIVRIDSFHGESWHKSNAALGTSIQIRCKSSLWSLGSVDINEIGSSVLHLARRSSSSSSSSGGGEGGDNRAIVVHVEVKLAEPSENCSVVVVVWQASVGGTMALSIRNETDLPVTVKQANLSYDEEAGKSGIFDVCVKPNEWLPFGWPDPDAGDKVLVTVGTSLRNDPGAPKKRVATISLLTIGEMLRLPDNTGRSGHAGEVVLAVVAEKCGRVLRISRLANVYDMEESVARFPATSSMLDIDIDDADSPVKSGRGGQGGGHSSSTPASPMTPGGTLGDGTEAASPICYGIGFRLSVFGISLVLDKPVRREFLSLYIDGLEGRLKIKGSSTSFEFIISDLQIDNYSETAICPVLLHSSKKEMKTGAEDDHGETVWEDAAGEGGREEEDSPVQQRGKSDSARQRVDADVPLVQLTVIKETPPGTSTAVFKYIAFRLLPLDFELDSATLQLLYYDLFRFLKFVSTDQALAASQPDEWIDSFNRSTLSPMTRMALADVYKAQVAVQQNKMYFEKLVIHPMKITLTFVQTVFPRKREEESFRSATINILTSLAGVDRMQLRLKSFEVEDALESRQSLINHITQKTWQDLQAQLGQIAGSLSVLGSPMGFARKVGHGVKAFFYEPYQGLVHSPHDFVVGIGKGTSSLVTDVLTGAMSSTVAFVGTASRGISHLSGDSEYVRKRAVKRQRNRANRGGIFDGIYDGGESVVSGLASGMSGLVTKPIEEARKSGVKGFFKGIGLGLIGAAVKPVLGISDGISSLATGIQNQVGDAVVYVRVRPARALERSTADASDLVIVPLNLEAANAQEFILKRAKSHSYEDAHLLYIAMETAGESIILSEVYIYWRRKHSLWGRTWANISHCFCSGDAVSIMLYAGANGISEVVSIPCGTAARALKVYAAMEMNAHRMGNPANVIPVDMIGKQMGHTPEERGERSRGMQSLSSRSTARAGPSKEALFALYSKIGRGATMVGELDGYRFGSANGRQLEQISGPESDVIKRAEIFLAEDFVSWQKLDEAVWRVLWEWECTHNGLQAARVSATILLNRSNSPIQIVRIHMLHGRNVSIIGSEGTGFELESRSIMPEGFAVVLMWAFSPSPIEVGHLKAKIYSAAFDVTIASTQRESSCEGKGGFSVGFLEKTVAEWWSKYVVLVL